MSQTYVLYDIPGKEGKCWSPNTWKIRAALNYKKVDYKTEWIEFPDIAPKLKELGIPPNPEGSFAEYTVPVLKFPDGSYVMDSIPIMEKLIQLVPDPELPLKQDVLKEMDPINGKVLGPLMPMIFPRARRDVICEASSDWFKQDRERRLGAPEEQYEKERGGEGAFEKAKPGQQELAEFLKKTKEDDGPFVLGSRVSYPDFVLAARCEFLKYVGKDVYDRVIGGVAGLPELHEACAPFFERNEH